MIKIALSRTSFCSYDCPKTSIFGFQDFSMIDSYKESLVAIHSMRFGHGSDLLSASRKPRRNFRSIWPVYSRLQRSRLTAVDCYPHHDFGVLSQTILSERILISDSSSHCEIKLLASNFPYRPEVWMRRPKNWIGFCSGYSQIGASMICDHVCKLFTFWRKKWHISTYNRP